MTFLFMVYIHRPRHVISAGNDKKLNLRELSDFSESSLFYGLYLTSHQNLLNRLSVRIWQSGSQYLSVSWRLVDDMASGKYYVFPDGRPLGQKDGLGTGIGQIAVGGGPEPVVLIA